MNGELRKDVEGSFHGQVWYKSHLPGWASKATNAFVRILSLRSDTFEYETLVNNALHDVQTALSCVLLQPCVRICGLMQAVWATQPWFDCDSPALIILKHSQIFIKLG